jgi:phytoene/squalene synthetase
LTISKGLCGRAQPFFVGERVDDAGWSTIERTLAEADPDRYVASFFAPATRRRALIALYAFDHEVARIGVVVREPMAGHIRLAWWREQIGTIYTDGEGAAPIPRALAEVQRAYRLPRELFDRYLDARALDLEELPFHDETALEAHADATSGSLMRLAVRVLGANDRADEAAQHAAIADAAAGHLRDLSFFAARRRCRLPATWLHEHHLNAEDVFAAREMTPALRLVLDRLAARAREALARLNASRFPRAATPVLGAATLARWVAGHGFDPFRPRQMPAWQRVCRLSLANMIWRF